MPRHRRVEVSHRLHASGRVLEELDEASVRRAVQVLLEQDCESIAVCLIHAYANPAHEQRVREIVQAMAPEISVTLSSEVLPEMKEYERTTTTTINAYAKPVASRYLTKLEQRHAQVERERLSWAGVLKPFEVPAGGRAQHAVEIVISPEHADVHAEPGLLGLALSNLLENARSFAPQGSTITLEAGPDRIAVQDSGPGVADYALPRLGERFFSTVRPDGHTKGSGLGLAMVYGITQRHGVDIDIRSAPGEGTTFRLTFPLTAPAPQSTGSIRIQKIPTHTKILLIDDDPLLLTSLRETLVNEGHQVQTANGGRAGIDAFLDSLKTQHPFPVVITDLGMPHVDGRAVAEAISSAAPNTAIIMLTGWGQRLVASGEIPPGVSVVMSKPPKLAELRQWLAELVERQAGQRTEKGS